MHCVDIVDSVARKNISAPFNLFYLGTSCCVKIALSSFLFERKWNCVLKSFLPFSGLLYNLLVWKILRIHFVIRGLLYNLFVWKILLIHFVIRITSTTLHFLSHWQKGLHNNLFKIKWIFSIFFHFHQKHGTLLFILEKN